MKAPPLVALLAVAVSVTSCAPTERHTVTSTRPAVSGTAYEMLQAKQERERDDAARAAEATQKQIDALRKELDDLKRRETEAWVKSMSTPQAPADSLATRAAIRQLQADMAAKARAEKAPAPPAPDPNAKAIDAEVAKIMAGDHSQLPPAQKLSSNNSGVATIKVTNDTAHTLTVLYSGPTSKKSVLSAHQSENVSLTAGNYSVAASVNDPSVIPFAGTDTVSGGHYTNQFYIVTTTR